MAVGRPKYSEATIFARNLVLEQTQDTLTYDNCTIPLLSAEAFGSMEAPEVD